MVLQPASTSGRHNPHDRARSGQVYKEGAPVCNSRQCVLEPERGSGLLGPRLDDSTEIAVYRQATGDIQVQGQAFDTIKVGESISGPSLSISRESIREFAEASLDFNPLHLDDG